MKTKYARILASVFEKDFSTIKEVSLSNGKTAIDCDSCPLCETCNHEGSTRCAGEEYIYSQREVLTLEKSVRANAFLGGV